MRIEVTKLFGHYDYTIPSSESKQPLDDVVILYGDNGCGKTTLLKLVFHLLSSLNNRRHRTTLHEIPFHSISISLTDGSQVSAVRKNGITGELRLTVHIPGHNAVSGVYALRKEFANGFESSNFEKRFIATLESLNIALYYLADDRQLTSDLLPEETFISEERQLQLQLYQRMANSSELPPQLPIQQERELARTLRITHDWIRKQLIKGANVGSENANTIYLGIARQLARKAPLPETDESVSEFTGLLTNLKQKGRDAARFGFAPELDVDQILTQMSAVSGDRREIIISIFRPYISGLVAKIESLALIQRATEKLVDGLSSFFSQDKRVEFNVADGFRFIGPDGSPLQPEWLSSGEQHLVKLFCCTLIARDKPSIFLIDEPELSLNIKWQRNLVRALTDLARGSPNQFFFATHSMEILSQHRNRVVELRQNEGM